MKFKLSRGMLILSCGIYRSPKGNIQEFLLQLHESNNFMTSYCVNKIKCTLVIGGDFNIDLMKCRKMMAVFEFADCMYSFGVFSVISLPTRITSHSSS